MTGASTVETGAVLTPARPGTRRDEPGATERLICPVSLARRRNDGRSKCAGPLSDRGEHTDE